MPAIPEKLGAAYYRGFLTPQGQLAYDRMQDQLLRGDYKGEAVFPAGPGAVTADDCFAAYQALRDDHPEYFYLGFSSAFSCRGGEGILRYPILYAPESIRRIQRQLRISLCRLVRGTAPLPLVEREILVYRRLACQLDYCNHNDVRDHNIVGPVLLSSGVCEGHNALLLLCFRRIGIPCIKVYGKSRRDRGHCWTIAWIHGDPVHCDVTWDRAEDGLVRFDYLNLSDARISGDHYAYQGAAVPPCPSEAWSYYRYRRLEVSSYPALRSRLRADAARDRFPILLHFRYTPASGDYLEETRRALAAERMGGGCQLLCNPEQKNVAVRRVP